MQMPPRSVAGLRALILILAIYVILGALYAVFTPAWQNPDEPAHFNFVVQVATTGTLPVLHQGDYDQAYLDTIKAHRFLAGMPIDSIRYEGHQPPLYYLLATPIYWLAAPGGALAALRALRLFGVLLGGAVILMVWANTRRLFPNKPQRAALAAGFVAFLPMHVAMAASVNNDTLAELLIAIGVFRLLGHLGEERQSTSGWALTGLVIGLGLVTKFQAYILVPLAGSVWLWGSWRTRRLAWRPVVAGLLPALLLSLPWWLRNAALYGFSDPLGLQRHNAIVTGQPRTAAWIASYGWSAYLERLVSFTFESFWGVFGWLGVFLDNRIYQALGLLTLLVMVGFVWQVWRWRQGRELLAPHQKHGLMLLALQLLLVILAFGWYNLTFVQHQGRYLFPALVPISIGFALGVEGLLTRDGSRLGALLSLAALAVLVLLGLAGGDPKGWAIAMAAAAAVTLFGLSRLSFLRRSLLAWVLLLLLALVAVQALFGAVVPQLG